MVNPRIPSYVPDAVKKVGGIILENWIQKLPDDKQKQAWAVTTRLLHDKRMRWVWKELTKRVRNRYEKTDELVYKPAEISSVFFIDDNGEKHEMAMGLNEALVTLFQRAVDLAVDPIPTITRDELAAYKETFDMTKHLIEIAKKLRALNRHPKIKALFLMWLKEFQNFPKGEFKLGRLYDWTNLDDFAEVLEKLADFFRRVSVSPDFKPEGPRPVVERRTADENRRAYVLGLAKVCTEIFKSPLYGCIAAISSAALKKKVSTSYVRKAVQSSSL